MKYEGAAYVSKAEEPTWFAEYVTHYNVVIRFLTLFNAGRFNMGTDVNMNKVITAKLYHGTETKVAHGMSTTPTRAIVMGRVEATYTRLIDATSVYITAKLLSTGVLADYRGLGANTVLVDDAALFRVGDSVKLGAAVKTITGTAGNKVSFNSNVTRGTVTRMILAQDEVRLTVF